MPSVFFLTANGQRQRVEAKPGQTLLEIAHQSDIDLEGSCEGSLACSTCHLVVARHWYDKLPPASEEEQDMLDFASGLTKTSRLGCQVVMEPRLDGLEVALPTLVRNMAAGE